MQLRLRDSTALAPKFAQKGWHSRKGPDDALVRLTSEPSCKDEARIGQKGELTRQWVQRGTRPRQPRDQRYHAAYLFAAACPEAEKTAALVLPHVYTEAMNLHLAEIARHIAVDAHAVVILGQAGWHGSNALIVPKNLTLLALPPYSPELNPIETCGSSSATTSSTPASTTATKRWLTPAATPGTGYAPFPARSARSPPETGQKRSIFLIIRDIQPPPG